MIVEAWLKSLIENYQLQAKLYEQIMGLAGQQRNLLQTGNWRHDMELIKLSLEKRQPLSKEIEEHKQENIGLQNNISKILKIEEFKLSNLVDKINATTYKLLQEQLLSISKQLNLLSQIDASNQELLISFTSQVPLAKIEPKQRQKAIKAYQQVLEQNNTYKDIKRS